MGQQLGIMLQACSTSATAGTPPFMTLKLSNFDFILTWSDKRDKTGLPLQREPFITRALGSGNYSFQNLEILYINNTMT